MRRDAIQFGVSHRGTRLVKLKKEGRRFFLMHVRSSSAKNAPP